MLKRLFIATVAVAAALAFTACGEKRGYSRGIFHGLVIDKTEEEVIKKMGQPLAIEKISDDAERLIYKGKTFDPDNFNTVDQKTIIDFERKDGKMIAVDVSFG